MATIGVVGIPRLKDKTEITKVRTMIKTQKSPYLIFMPSQATPKMEAAAENYWNNKRFSALSKDPRTWQGVYAKFVEAFSQERAEIEQSLNDVKENLYVSEEILESLWRHTKGIDPETGQAWLTPRMLRASLRL